MIGPERHAARSGWVFLAPALLLIAVFFFLPVLAALLLSFTDFDIYALGDLDRLRLVGFSNYLHLLQSPLFWTALGNTCYFVVVGGPLSVAVSLGAALQVNSRLTRFPGLFLHRVLPAGGDDAGGGGGGVALSLPSALRVAELRAEPARQVRRQGTSGLRWRHT